MGALLPGRSDDAVRNRWNRLKEMGIGNDPPLAAPSAKAAALGEAVAGSTSTPPFSFSSAPMAECDLASTDKFLASSSVVAGEHGRPSATCSAVPGEKHVASEREKPERVSWSRAEDETILRGVSGLGHKWNKISEQLPGRTDHAIRNRFHRLQTLLEDRQRQQQR